MNRFMYKGFMYESKEPYEFNIKPHSFKLIRYNTILSETGYNVEPVDEWFNEQYISLYDLKTPKKYRGRGFAKTLLNSIFKYTKDTLKINIITLIVDKNNIPAIKLYEKCGFKVFMEYDDSYSLIKHLE